MADFKGRAGVPHDDSFRHHIRRLLALALPLIGARAADFVIPVADASMVGRHDVLALAALGVGWQTWIFFYVSGLGTLVAVTILSSRAHGAGDLQRGLLVWRCGLRQAAVMGVILLLLCQFGESGLRALGLDPALAEGGGAVLRAYGWGAPAAMMYLATSFFMAGSGRPLPDMLIMASALPLKLALNWLLIGGHAGIPALGAVGAALATSIMIWIVAIVFALYVLARHRAELRACRPSAGDRTAVGKRLIQLGAPIALSMALETGSFLVLALIAGHIGPEEVSAYRAAMSVAMTPFMIGTSLASATSVRVGHAIGRDDPAGMRRAAASGFAVVAAVMVLFAVPMALLSAPLASVFTGDAALLPAIAACLLVTAAYLVFEGLQVALKLVLRSLGDIWLPFWISVGSYWLIGVACAALLGIGHGLGAPGIVAGLGIAMVVSALCNALRYRRVAWRRLTRL